MSNLFGGTPRTQDTNPPATTLRIQTSAAGAAIPIGWGLNRLAPNMLWYNGFAANAVQQASSGGGGKGVGGGNAGKAGGGTTQTTYSWNMIMGLCEGPINSVPGLFIDKAPDQTPANFGFGFALGSYAQTANGSVQALYPNEARAYRGIAYAVSFPFANATSPEMPAINFEVAFGTLPAAGTGSPDSNGADVIKDVLTNVHYGADFPSARIGDVVGGVGLSTYYNYGQAVGIWVSPVLVRQVALNSFLTDLMTATVAEPVWSGGALKVIPYYDQAVTANGGVYTPNTTPIYDLTDNDFLPNGQTSYATPVVVKRKSANDRFNSVKVGYSSRTNRYNPVIFEAKDDAGIQAFGPKGRDPIQLDMLCNDASAQVCAHLQLGREQVMNTYEFALPAKFVLLEPMDCVTITDVHLGLSRQLVRIKEITENDDYTLTLFTEDCLIGAASPPLYGQQVGAGFIPNYNLDPGLTLAPFFFEPPDQLANGLEVWMAVTGIDLTKWGGCLVYASYDDINFQFVGRQMGPTRIGVLTAPLATTAVATTPPTIDTTHTLSVDLTQSGSQLLTATLADMLGLATLCYVGGELLAYQTATSTGANKYDLTTLNRGAYGTTPQAVSSGAPFVRCDLGVFRLPFTQDRIGQTLYIKLVSFNQYGGGPQSLSTVSPYTYIIQGTALASPLPDITSFTSVFVGNITQLSWKEITDFRPVLYEIRKGPSWDAGTVLGRYAHPPVPALGDGTYQIKAVSTPVSGLTVYSTNALSLILVGSVIPLNVKATFDEQATNFIGTLVNLINDGTFVRTFGGGDILAVADVYAIADAGDAAVTVSIASPCVIGWTAHGRTVGDNVALATTGALPTGVTELQEYFVKTVIDADNFTLSATNGGAVINTSGVQSGVHRAYAFGDIYAFGAQSSGTYTIPVTHEVDVGYVAPCLVAITFASSGVPVSQNFFGYNPLFLVTDFFGASSNRFVDVHPELALSQDGSTYGAFFVYQAGVYSARKFKSRMDVNSLDAATIAFLTQYVFTVYVPTRVDNWALIAATRTSLNALALLAGGMSLTFLPDTQATAAPFNGGVSNPTQPSMQVTILNAAPGDLVAITNLTLAGCTIQVQNTGIGVARTVSIRPEGY